MNKLRKSLLDNWSLEHAGILLNGDTDINSIPTEKFTNNFAGLSIYINALLLYDQTNYLSNGFEKEWTRFNLFTQKNLNYINGLPADSLDINWDSPESYSDQGISNYLKSSNRLELDLFMSPERSSILKDKMLNNRHTTHLETFLKKIDKKIKDEAETIWLPDTQLGILENFKFPSITQYVLSNASCVDDLLSVIIQIKKDRKICRIINELSEISRDTKKTATLQKEIETRIKLAFGNKSDNHNAFSLSLTVMFISLNRAVNTSFFNRKDHFLFLKDIVSCRSESGHLRKNIKRIFNKTL